MTEIWKVHNESGLPVSTFGRVVHPELGVTFGIRERKFDNYNDPILKGHMYVLGQQNGWERKYYVHRLVLETFSPCPCREVWKFVDHINEIKDDNYWLNLRWQTPSGNNLNRQFTRGYSWNKRNKCWRAQLRIGNNNKKIKTRRYLHRDFKTSYEARQAYTAIKPYAVMCEEDIAYQKALGYNFNPLWKLPMALEV